MYIKIPDAKNNIGDFSPERKFIYMNSFDRIEPDTYETLPAGLAMAFAQRPEALVKFTSLSSEKQNIIIERARSVRSKGEMKNIVSAIEHGESFNG